MFLNISKFFDNKCSDGLLFPDHLRFTVRLVDFRSLWDRLLVIWLFEASVLLIRRTWAEWKSTNRSGLRHWHSVVETCIRVRESFSSKNLVACELLEFWRVYIFLLVVSIINRNFMSSHLDFPESLLLIIKFEVLIQLRSRSEGVKDWQHPFACLGEDLLAVTPLARRFVFVKRVLDVDELSVRDVFNVNPVKLNRTRPFPRLSPQLIVLHILNSTFHSGHSTKLFRLVDAEEKVDFSLFFRVFFSEDFNL